MIRFEALTASHSVITHGFMREAQEAASEVLDGEIEFPEEDGGLVILGAEELAVMQKKTQALAEISIAQLMRLTAAELPDTFIRRATIHDIGKPRVVNVEGLEGNRRELVLPIASRNLIDRFLNERRAFQRGIELSTGVKIPWLPERSEIVVGVVGSESEISKKKLMNIKRLGPKKGRLGRGETKLETIEA